MVRHPSGCGIRCRVSMISAVFARNLEGHGTSKMSSKLLGLGLGYGLGQGCPTQPHHWATIFVSILKRAAQ